MFNSVPKIDVDVTLVSEHKVILNSWLGSTLRGAISYKMMKKYCNNKTKECASCEYRSTCQVGIMFNSSEVDSKELNTNPIVLNVFNNNSNEACNEIKLKLTLFGNGIMAFQSILLELKDGINVGKEKTLFKLKDAYYTSGGQPVFDRGIMRNIKITEPEPLVINSNTIRVEFISPLVVKESFRVMDFHNFMRACLIRTKAINNTVGLETNYSYNELVEKAKNVRTVANKMRYKELVRYSTSKNKYTKLAGRTGYLEYTGDLEEFLPYISIAKDFNIGKWCTMGLGHFIVTDRRVENEI